MDPPVQEVHTVEAQGKQLTEAQSADRPIRSPEYGHIPEETILFLSAELVSVCFGREPYAPWITHVIAPVGQAGFSGRRT
jgi:hypothetical protein